MVASPMTLTLERLKVVDFTTPFMQDSLGIVTPRPKEATDLFQLLNPFSLQVWLSLLGFFLLAVVMTTLILVASRSPWSCACRDGSGKESIYDNILLLISCFCQQGRQLLCELPMHHIVPSKSKSQSNYHVLKPSR